MIVLNPIFHLFNQLRLVWYCGIWLVCQTWRYIKLQESARKWHFLRVCRVQYQELNFLRAQKSGAKHLLDLNLT